MSEHANIYEAVNAVMQEVGYVHKTKSKSGDVPYTFAGEAALIAAIRPAMVEHGIIVYPAGVSDVVLERETSGKGTPYTHFHATYTFMFVHTASGTYFATQVEGEGIDYGDKAVSKAATIAYKYALRQTFCIETGDDPDKYGSDNDFGGLKSGNDTEPVRKSTNVKPVNTPQKPQDATTALPVREAVQIPTANGKRPYSASAVRDAIQANIAARVAKDADKALEAPDDKAQALAQKWRNLLAGTTPDVSGDKARYAITSYVLALEVKTFKGLALATIEALDAWLHNDPKLARSEAGNVFEELAAQA